MTTNVFPTLNPDKPTVDRFLPSNKENKVMHLNPDGSKENRIEFLLLLIPILLGIAIAIYGFIKYGTW